MSTKNPRSVQRSLPGRKSKRGRGSSLLTMMEENVMEENPFVERAPKEIEADISLPTVPLVEEPSLVQVHEKSNIDETSLHMIEGEEVLHKTRVFTCFDCPPIPLCRMIPYAKVRGLRDDVSSLKLAFGKEGYMPEKGVFIVSIRNLAKEEKIVDDNIISSWDEIWRDINKDFEAELAVKPALHILSKRMFYVWEGNHRTVAWMQAIKDHYEDRKEKHVRVLSTIIDPSKVSEIALLSSLQRMNILNTQALVATSLRDELVNTHNICAARAEDYLQEFPDEDVKLIVSIRKKHTKGMEPWFPLTRKYLARLVYSVQMTNEYHKKVDPLKSTLSKEDYEKMKLKEMKDLNRKYSDRIGKILNVIDPKLGEEWWQKVLSLKWSNDSFATLEKLNLVALCLNVSLSTKIWWLSLLEANKTIKAVYGLVRGDHEFRGWLLRESTFEIIYSRAFKLLEDLKEPIMGLHVPQEFSLKSYFEEIRMEKRKFLFGSTIRSEGHEKRDESKSSKKLDLVQMASQRLVYRFLLYVKEGGHVLSIPTSCKPWLSTKDESTTMFPPIMHTLTKWELDNCPWWIDMDGGEVLEREKEKYAKYGKSIVRGGEKDQSRGKEVPQGDSENVAHDVNIIYPSEHSYDEEIEIRSTQGGKQDIKIAKKTNTYVYVCEDNHSFGLSNDDHKCIALVGDYIEIGKDFACGNKNASYTIMHEHFVKNRCMDGEYFRRGKSVTWAVDLVFLDLPFGGALHGSISNPPWDVLTEDHVRYGTSVAAASMADMGWLMIMASCAGNAINWIERYVRVSDLETWHRVFVFDHSSYGLVHLGSTEMECNTSILYMVRRRGFTPPIHLERSKPLFDKFHLQPLATCVTHYLPSDKRAKRLDGSAWRGGLEKSYTFLSCYLEMLCRPRGMVLELGCGTAPLAKACVHSGRKCVSMDCDDTLMSLYLVPLLGAKRMPVREEVGTSRVGDDEVDVLAGVSPYD